MVKTFTFSINNLLSFYLCHCHLQVFFVVCSLASCNKNRSRSLSFNINFCLMLEFVEYNSKFLKFGNLRIKSFRLINGKENIDPLIHKPIILLSLPRKPFPSPFLSIATNLFCFLFWELKRLHLLRCQTRYTQME